MCHDLARPQPPSTMKCISKWKVQSWVEGQTVSPCFLRTKQDPHRNEKIAFAVCMHIRHRGSFRFSCGLSVKSSTLSVPRNLMLSSLCSSGVQSHSAHYKFFGRTAFSNFLSSTFKSSCRYEGCCCRDVCCCVVCMVVVLYHCRYPRHKQQRQRQRPAQQ